MLLLPASAPAPIWNSLEVAKLGVSFLTPLSVAVLGIWFTRIARRFEELQWANRKVIEKRFEVYDDLAAGLNDLLCFFTFVGNWKEVEPPIIVGLKRSLDRKFHLSAPLFSDAFGDHYHEYINACFSTYSGWGQDPKLRTPIGRRREAAGSRWRDEWNSMFEPDTTSTAEVVRDSYRNLMRCFSAELGVGLSPRTIHAGRVPANVK